MDVNITDNDGNTFADSEGTPYGHELKRKHFFLGDSYLNLNAGSYGATSRPVRAAQEQFFLEQEAHPDHWFRSTLYKRIHEARQSIAELVHAPLEDVVLVENASLAVNSLLRSYGFKVRCTVQLSVDLDLDLDLDLPVIGMPLDSPPLSLFILVSSLLAARRPCASVKHFVRHGDQHS